MPTLYADVSDLRETLSGTDSGTGTAAALSDAQLTLALQAASSRISVYAGNVFDSSTPEAVPPDIFHDLALDLATFWAYTTYLKSKVISPTHPVYLRYTSAMAVLNDVRDGKIRLDPVPPGGIGLEPGIVINRVPRVFTGADSNTRRDPLTGAIEADAPAGMWTPGWLNDWGAEYQG